MYENNTESLSPPVIIALIIFGLILVLLFLLSYYPVLIKNTLAKVFLPPRLNSRYKPYLIANFPFYNKLSDAHQLLFERRVQKFINMKEFIARGGLQQVTPQMKALIAGSAIQLTFGYPAIYFRHFYRILIYPDSYYSSITRQYHKGEVNRGGIIVVSWAALKEGFNCHADGYHLGFHEMAHALWLINIIDNAEYNFYDRSVMKAFDEEARNEILKIRQGEAAGSLFRSYGASSREEFFAVAVEVFFERSMEFKNYNARLYDLLSRILKIDPTAICISTGIKNLAS